ncbi:MAG TPA: glycoside hydrolase family 9 protein [Paludibacter sp.]|nr:glycoside hydrolase family 9 protein [Paludibacter sp.]
MTKRIILLFLSIFCISIYSHGIDAWIRINQLGYLPGAQKKAVFISETPRDIKQFSIHDALTNKELAVLNNITTTGKFLSFESSYILDFSSFHTQGAFYIRAGLVYSPTIFINKNCYLGSADFLLNYFRRQHGGNQVDVYVSAGAETPGVEPKVPTVKTPGQNDKPQSNQVKKKRAETVGQFRAVDVGGGWPDNGFSQHGATTAHAVWQLLFAYQMNPAAFSDKCDTWGNKTPNNIPDILDEAKWGLDWLLKMYPAKDTLFFQTGQGPGVPRTVFMAGGKNRTTGIASIAGKYASAFALGALVFADKNPAYADSLSGKALESYELGKENPGVCQSVPISGSEFLEEENWADDMELAATQLYRLTYSGKYLKEAASYGRMEPVSPWMCSDTAKHYQWYPFLNYGHYMLTNVENPRYHKEFLENLRNGIQRMQLQATGNPFNIGIPMVRASNSLVVALATQCRLYRSITNDSSFLEMENSLTDWLLGRNPWGTSLIVGLPQTGKTPVATYSEPASKAQPVGALVSGPVSGSDFRRFGDIRVWEDGEERFQSDWGVYHDSFTDYLTNKPLLDGTASLAWLLASKQQEGVGQKSADRNEYVHGGITRTDDAKKQISLVFEGHEYIDGYKVIQQTLKKLHIQASFFFSGDFYRNPKHEKIIKTLQEDNHYLGGSSDKHLLYCSPQKPDSMFVDKRQFLADLRGNYQAMEKFGIRKMDAPFFLPANGCYNDSISKWCLEAGLQLVSMTPGTLSNMDSTIPEMRGGYFSSVEIVNRIRQVESKQGLNGYVLLFHLGSDKRRQDKFYPELNSLLFGLVRSGYDFVDLYKSTDVFDREVGPAASKKQKRKN